MKFHVNIYGGKCEVTCAATREDRTYYRHTYYFRIFCWTNVGKRIEKLKKRMRWEYGIIVKESDY